MTTRVKDSYSIQSVEHALDLLEALGDEGDGAHISELSAQLRMNKSSIFRLLATLEVRGYVQQVEDTKKYRLGMSAYETAQKFLQRMTLLRKARPVMEGLARCSGEAVYLVIARNDEVLMLDMVDSCQQVRLAPLVGRRFPLAGNAAGRVLLACGVGGGGQGLSAGDSHVQNEHAVIRRVGLCIEEGGCGDGVVSMAVPIYNHRSEIEGGLTLLMPSFRLDAARREQLASLLMEAGATVSSMLGYFRGGLGGHGLPRHDMAAAFSAR